MSSKRAAGLVGALSVAGFAISVYIAYVHSQIVADIAPSCDVNATFSCTTVLSSKYAYLFDVIPVAWAALLTYAGFFGISLGLVVALPRAQSRRRAAGALFAGAIGGAIYSVYLAGIALVVLRAVCLLCTGLYVVSAGMLIATALLLSSVRRETSRGRDEGTGLVRWIGIGAGVGLAVVLGLVVWEAVGPEPAPDPDFVLWYEARPVVQVPPVNGHTKGSANAVVVISEFSDFECGHCAQMYRTFKSLLPRYREDVRVEFFHYPLDSACNPAVQSSFHRNACLAAVAAECASAQGKFWPYHDLLFDNQRDLGRDTLLRLADRVGLDRDAFSTCLASDDARAVVARDVAEGARLGVQSTPTLFFNHRMIRGALEADKLEQAIRIERDLSAHQN